MGGPVFTESVEGVDVGARFGVLGRSNDNDNESVGVLGKSIISVGVRGESTEKAGVLGVSNSGIGTVGVCDNGVGAFGYSINGVGVRGHSRSDAGVAGDCFSGQGVKGTSFHGVGVQGQSRTNYGVYGHSYDGIGVFGSSANYIGVFGSSAYLAAHLRGNVKIEGNVEITGTLNKDGGRFKIDHPLDPANKYLSHSFVESPDMKNVYDGVVVLDDKGEAEIELPDWFGALNKDFRYQLTAIGAPGPNLHISEEISSDGVATTTNYYSNSSNNSNKNKNNNKSSSRFKVAGGISAMKVSWQVTGIRKDPWANAHRISVEEDKPAKERGYYTYPELYGQPEERGISRLLVPEIERKSCRSS